MQPVTLPLLVTSGVLYACHFAGALPAVISDAAIRCGSLGDS